MRRFENLSYAQMQKLIVEAEQDFVAARVLHQNARAALGKQERQSLDDEFAALFMRAIKNDDDALVQMQKLAKMGASCDAFVDDELSDRPNATKALVGACKMGAFSKTQSAAFECVPFSGDAFMRNKYYVGNGGDLLAPFLTECFLQKGRIDPTLKTLFFLTQAQAQTQNCEKFRRRFFDGFAYLARADVNYDPSDAREHVRYFLQRLLYEDAAFVERYFCSDDEGWRINAIARFVSALPLPLLFEFLDESEKQKNRRMGLREIECLRLAFLEQSKKLLGFHLRSKDAKRKLCALLKRSAWLRSLFISNAELVFLLLREPKVLRVFIKREAPALVQLVNKSGDNLLQALDKKFGRNERTREMLLHVGFREP